MTIKGEWIKKMWCIYIVEYYSTMKKNEMTPFAAAWMNVEIITLSESFLLQRLNRSLALIGLDRCHGISAQ